MGFLFWDCFRLWGSVSLTLRKVASMKLKLIVAILLIAALPVCAQAQKPSVAVRQGDAQQGGPILRGAKAKTRTYCDKSELGEQIEQANENTDSKSADELAQKVGELEKKTGSRICRIDGRDSGHRSRNRSWWGDHVSIDGPRQVMYEVTTG